MKDEVKKLTESKKVFRPQVSFILNIIFTLDVFLLFVYGIGLLPLPLAVLVALVSNLILLLIWFKWLRDYLSLEVFQGKMTGPTEKGKRITMQFRRVDHKKTHSYQGKKRHPIYKDIYSLDGEFIRIFRPVLDRRQFERIMQFINEYPFRDQPREPVQG